MSDQTVTLFYSTDKNFFLSQWYPSKFTDIGIDFYSAEQYMMFRKALCFHDQETAQAILQTFDPWMHKQLGRQVRNFDESVWIQKRYHIVKAGNRRKFMQNPILMAKLCATKGTLAEASPRDKIWGIGMSSDHPDVLDKSKWGLNLLGLILTELRNEFIARKLN